MIFELQIIIYEFKFSLNNKNNNAAFSDLSYYNFNGTKLMP